ncbi:MAG: ATP-binding protein, partial [Pseudomonadota bacterium]
NENGEATDPPELLRRPEIIYGLRNIIENAAGFAMSKVEISGTHGDGQIAVTVKDNGPGFSPDILARLGEPYINPKAANQRTRRHNGLGLGFFIAKTLLEHTGGTVVFGNRDTERSGTTRGAQVRVQWPEENLLFPDPKRQA